MMPKKVMKITTVTQTLRVVMSMVLLDKNVIYLKAWPKDCK